MKIDFFAEVTITPLRPACFSMKSRCPLKSCKVAASKMFAPESGRSKIKTHTSSAISRRIKDTAGDKVIDLVWPVSRKIQAAQLNGGGFASRGLGATIALAA